MSLQTMYKRVLITGAVLAGILLTYGFYTKSVLDKLGMFDLYSMTVHTCHLKINQIACLPSRIVLQYINSMSTEEYQQRWKQKPVPVIGWIYTSSPDENENNTDVEVYLDLIGLIYERDVPFQKVANGCTLLDFAKDAHAYPEVYALVKELFFSEADELHGRTCNLERMHKVHEGHERTIKGTQLIGEE